MLALVGEKITTNILSGIVPNSLSSSSLLNLSLSLFLLPNVDRVVCRRLCG